MFVYQITTNILEFTQESWLALIFVASGSLVILITSIYLLIYFKIDKHNLVGSIAKSHAIETSLNIIMRAFINKGTNNGFKSQTYKFLVFVMMLLGFISLTYYKAQMNAALNADINNIPLQNWNDVAESNYKVLVWIGTVDEAKFSNVPDGELGKVLKDIYTNQILVVPVEKQLQKIGMKESVSAMLSGDYIVYSDPFSYVRFEEYPCEITDIKVNGLR